MYSNDISLSAERWSSQTSSLSQSLMQNARLPLCVTDPNLSDNPIVFVNDAFCSLTGYTSEEVVGRNCRFLQGAETTDESVATIKSIIADEAVSTVELVNYRKDGGRFFNALQLGPIYGPDGDLAYFFGSQLDVTAEHERKFALKRLVEAEFRHRLLNMVAVLSSLVKMTGRETGMDARFVDTVIARLNAVGDAHILALSDPSAQPPDFAATARVVLAAYAPRGEDSYTLKGPHVALQQEHITVIAMVLHELATNAVKHGGLSTLQGHVDLSWETRDGNIHMLWRESDGPAVSRPVRESGSRIIQRLIASSGGALTYDWDEKGLVANFRLPEQV